MQSPFALKTKTRFFSVVLAAIVCRNVVVWSNLKIKKKKEEEERDESLAWRNQSRVDVGEQRDTIYGY